MPSLYIGDGRYDPADALTVKYTPISISASGNNTIVAGVTNKKIRIISYQLVCAEAVTVKFQSGASGTDLSGAMSFGANGGISTPESIKGHFETLSGALLNIVLSSGVAVAGHLTYVEI